MAGWGQPGSHRAAAKAGKHCPHPDKPHPDKPDKPPPALRTGGGGL